MNGPSWVGQGTEAYLAQLQVHELDPWNGALCNEVEEQVQAGFGADSGLAKLPSPRGRDLSEEEGLGEQGRFRSIEAPPHQVSWAFEAEGLESHIAAHLGSLGRSPPPGPLPEWPKAARPSAAWTRSSSSGTRGSCPAVSSRRRSRSRASRSRRCARSGRGRGSRSTAQGVRRGRPRAAEAGEKFLAGSAMKAMRPRGLGLQAGLRTALRRHAPVSEKSRTDAP